MRFLLYLILLSSFRLPAQEIYFPAKAAIGDLTGISPFLPATEPSSVAKIFYRVSGGSLRNVYEPQSSHLYGVSVSSARTFSRTTLSGHAGYIRHHRIGQQYSSLFHPSAPLITFADSISGTQKGETYLLSGTVVHRFIPGWTAGISAGYSAGNNAKDTDPRNKNDLSSLTIAPGIGYHTGKIQSGVSFSWIRERETVSYESFGNEIKNGLTFYPLWFYTTESFSDGTNAKRDYLQNLYTVILRFQHQNKNWKTHFQPEYATGRSKIWINPSTRQSAGETTTQSFRFNNRTSYTSQRLTHVFSPEFSRTGLSGYDLQQKKENKEQVYKNILKIKRSGVTYTTYRINYLFFPSQEERWKTDFSFLYRMRRSTFRLYPAVFRQSIARYIITAGYSRRFKLSPDYFDCGLQASYSSGTGRQSDGNMSGNLAAFRLAGSLQNREYHYLTASTAGAAIKLKYTSPARPGCKTGFYFEVSNHFRYAMPHSAFQNGKYSLCFCSAVLF